MTDPAAQPRPGWRASRYSFAGFYFASFLVAWFCLRLVLFFAFRPSQASAGEIFATLSGGFQRDLFAALVETLPLLIWFLFLSNRSFAANWHRRLLYIFSFIVISTQVFLLFVEFFFFEEFKSRFNTVAVDYLIYPYEVFVNIWQSYHVGIVIAVCVLLGLAWTWLAARLFAGMWNREYQFRTRLWPVVAVAALTALLAATFNLKGAYVSKDRTLNEIANNGALSFVTASVTRHLEYSAFYVTLPEQEAYERSRRMLTEEGAQFVEPGNSIRRRISGDTSRPRLNVVVMLEESLGSEFWGCLGRTNTLTPEMDRLAESEGLLFTNIYACGNRTVRGMEGVLSSFPPLPGDSIVKRDQSDNVETLARVLKRDGYSTIFLYGGRGFFDGMRSYAVRNGYEKFVEQKHFDHPTFTTSWGVCDEDLFMRAIEEFRELSKTGKPFCATVLSVSNHKPYTYPEGRIPEDPKRQRRAHAVKYADYALGQFFRAARKESFWTNTIFVVVADHGARVYGKQSIPIHSYEIPLVIAGPAVVKDPARVGQLGSSLDVTPTILGMLGRPYETLFFGRDLLHAKPEAGRAFVNHNRDIGMLARERLVVLGLSKHVEFYEGDPKHVDMSLLAQPTGADLELEKDAAAIFQVADDLYTHKRYRIDAGP